MYHCSGMCYLQSTCTPKSARSGSRSASLYDELCSSRDSLSYMGLMQSEDLSSTCGSDEAEREEEATTTNVSSKVPSLYIIHKVMVGELKKVEGGGIQTREWEDGGWERERERERREKRESTKECI